MASWVFTAFGTPVAQGSKKGFVNPRTKGVILVDALKGLKPWRDTVTSAAIGAGACLEGPVAVRMVFSVPRSKSAPKRETVPYKARGDLDKLCRAALDSIVNAGLLHDDAQVADFYRLAKVFAGRTEWDSEALPVPGVIIAATEILPGGDARAELQPLTLRAAEKAWARAKVAV